MTAASSPGLTADELALLEGLLAKLSGPGADLPYPLFRFITEVVATANVDLVVLDAQKGVLLAWRDDPFGTGWHVPGSIIRHREEIAHRIRACAEDEFGCELAVAERPVALIQIFDDRGHSISLCYPATLQGQPSKRIIGECDTPRPGELRWFKQAPEQLYPSHLVYQDLLEELRCGRLGAGIQLFTQHVGRRDAAQASPAGAIGSDAPLT